MKNLLLLPSRNLSATIPIILIAGFLVGLEVDTSPLKNFILPVTVFMIYPTMIGFKAGELLNFKHLRLCLFSMAINFFLIPLLAYVMGTVFLHQHPQLFAGLAIASLLPTSNMTIAFTMFARGNVPAAIKLTVLGLMLGSLLAPWYLLLMVGRYLPVDVLATLKTITLVVFLPFVMGTMTYRLFLLRHTKEQFERKIKPYLPALCSWGAIFIVFTSISINAHQLVDNSGELLTGFLVQLLFYAANYFLVYKIATTFFHQG